MSVPPRTELPRVLTDAYLAREEFYKYLISSIFLSDPSGASKYRRALAYCYSVGGMGV